MKKKLLFVCLFFILIGYTKAQIVNGSILSNADNLTVVKVWGTHYERGYAYGYLCSSKIMSVWNNYILPNYGSYIPLAKQIIGNSNMFSINPKYKTEVEAMLDGIGAAGYDTTGLSYLDLYVVNFTTDLEGFVGKKLPSQNCSSLLNWGNATIGTDLNGKSVICHHLDAPQSDTAIINNQVLVIHIPSEIDEQPWFLTGTAGQMVASQAVNSHGLCVFLNTVDGFSAEYNKQYEPVTITIRNAIESRDFNNDGVNNVNDIRAAVSTNINGYARGFIICAVAPSSNLIDSLIGGIIELAPQQPYITNRTIDFQDSIVGTNLYAANSMIKRNNAYDFCSRYNDVKNEMNANYNGQNIGSQDNWNIMKNFSTQNTNLQMIQVIPENNILKISVRDSEHLAYQKEPLIFDISQFFIPTNIIEQKKSTDIELSVFPNPVIDKANVVFNNFVGISEIELYDETGNLILSINFSKKTVIDLSNLPKGVFILKVKTNVMNYYQKLIKL